MWIGPQKDGTVVCLWRARVPWFVSRQKLADKVSQLLSVSDMGFTVIVTEVNGHMTIT